MEFFLDDFHFSYFVRMLVSFACGLMFGLERQLRAKPFGIRACVLICMGTTLFVYVGQEALTFASDSTRVIGQVITGIGFLGAGAILQKDSLVLGITSAATIWVIAAVGAAVGAGHLGYGVATTVLCVSLLTISRQIEMRVSLLHQGGVSYLRSDLKKRRRDDYDQ